MNATCFRRGILSLLFVSVFCCNKTPTATQIITDRMEQSMASRPAHWDYMVDNAMLHDMSLSDIHFIPYSAELNGTGAARLDRMVPLLDVYGGTVRLETGSADEDVIVRRLAHTREYLSVAGCDMGRVEVAAMLPGGRGMPADQAIEAYDRMREEKKSAQPTTLSLGGGAAQSN